MSRGRPSKKADLSGLSLDDLAESLKQTLSPFKQGEGDTFSGDEATLHTWGIPIPHLAFQWLLGGLDVIPAQKFIGISGLEKSFKSTLQFEIGDWYIKSGGFHIYIDAELKLSSTMRMAKEALLAEAERKRRRVVPAGTLEALEQEVTAALKWAKNAGRERPKGQRIPVLVTIDSLSQSTTEENAKEIMKEGFAEGRSFPVEAGSLTRYLMAANNELLGSTINISWVQHMKQLIDGGGHGGPRYREKGPNAGCFQCSSHIRMRKIDDVRAAGHALAPFPDQPIEGHTILLKCERSCLGPDHRELALDVVWQYEEIEGKDPKQYMWFDWDGALGRMLVSMKYADKDMYASDKERLDKAIYFTLAKGKYINCEALGLKEVTQAQFGKAIRENIDVYDAVRKFLRIAEYTSFQDADIDWGTDTEVEA